ncbi:Antiviral helicase ski2 [Sorochytrium milnesiophthora]
MGLLDAAAKAETAQGTSVVDPNDPLYVELAFCGLPGDCELAKPDPDQRITSYRPTFPLPFVPHAELAFPRNLKADLVERFLTPRKSFEADVLYKAQQLLERPARVDRLIELSVGGPVTTLEFVRTGFTGDVVGVREVACSVGEGGGMTAKSSTSMQRELGARGNFVRGKSGYSPFAPGGLENEVMQQQADIVAHEMAELHFDADQLETVPPGFERGLVLAADSAPAQTQNHRLDVSSILRTDDQEFAILDQLLAESAAEDDNSGALLQTAPGSSASASGEDDATLDKLLPTDVVPTTRLARPVRTDKRQRWAHVVDVNAAIEDFDDVIPQLAHEYPFELDAFQKQAVYHLEKGDSVFVAAHTSAGKTVVAEYAIALAQKHMTKAIYTSPIKALSNQKFRDFHTTFEDVGILTGDVQINPEASCLIMTTEILRSMLYRGADLIRDVEFVIFDEVHYVNDLERGVVWEEVIIMLPAHVSLILLSATVPNTVEFADWVGRTKKKDIYVISTLKRPVPLEHYLYVPSVTEYFKVVDAKKNFLPAGFKQAFDHVTGITKAAEKNERLALQAAANAAANGGRGGGEAGRGRGRGGSSGAAGSSKFSTAVNSKRTERTDRNIWVHLVALLKKRTLLPVIVFTFSKRKCEEYANALFSADLTTGAEKSEVHLFIEKSLARLKGDDRQLPQVLRMREMLGRGVGVHHGGLLPIVKEMVEILFGRGLVKVLFATETFAMGVNMPARCVVFSNTRKHDGRSFRELLPGEYTQMSGRAGRRGLDDTGVVIVVCNDGSDRPPETAALQTMILGQPTKLESQFRLTYNMILSLLRVEALKVEEMIKRSFSENSSQKALPEQEKLFQENQVTLNALPKLQCSICSEDIERYYECSTRITELSHRLNDKAINSSMSGRAFNIGRIVIVNNSMYRNCVGVILKATGGNTTLRKVATFSVLVLTDDSAALGGIDKPPKPLTRITVPKATDALRGAVVEVPFTDIATVTQHSVKVNPDEVSGRRAIDSDPVVQELLHKLRQEAEQFSSDNGGGVPENNWGKIKDLEFQELYADKCRLMTALAGFQCTLCPDLDQHYALVHQERLLKDKLSELQMTISDQNLELLPDYHQRIQVLQEMDYVDKQCTVQLKGRVACEINSGDELVLTELILNNMFGDLDVAETVALLSSFVFQEKTQHMPTFTPRLAARIDTIVATATRVAQVQEAAGVAGIRVESFLSSRLNFGLVEVVYEWARGMSFKQIMGLTDVLEGTIVRCIVRLEETCREVKDAARLVGDSALYTRMEEAGAAIKRDIVFCGSLYL